MPRRSSRYSFLVKLPAALLLIAASHFLFHDFEIGSWIAGLMLGWVAVLALLRPAMRRGTARIALLAACGFALTMLDQPTLLGWVLFWIALSMAALLPRAGFDDALRWGLRLVCHGVTGPFAPLLDLMRRPKPRRGRSTLGGTLGMLALPILMTAVFVALFASANPLIEQVLGQIRFLSPWDIAFWLCVLVVVWPSLRPRAFTTRLVSRLPDIEVTLPGTRTDSVLISLALFNLVFAVQNAMDIAFLWSGALLPSGVTLADYAHRGAYPLIVTALLAGVFVLTTLKPGSATAANPLIRRLVVAWVAQNLLLVASSILRTCDYIAVYMLTPLRIAALVWMVLVALGLVLICWRMLTGKSARWLINGNALAAATVLSVFTLLDPDAMAANWNVRHAKEVGGKGVALDLCAMQSPSALVSLAELERRPLTPDFRDRVRATRDVILRYRPSLTESQDDWHRWTWRNARRLAQMRALLGPNPAQPMPVGAGQFRNCDGRLVVDPDARPAPPPSPTPTPLTGSTAQ